MKRDQWKKVLTKDFLKKNFGWALIPLFWTSCDVSSGFQWEVSRLNPASYLCYNTHVGNSNWLPCCMGIKRRILGNVHHVHLRQVLIRLPTLAHKSNTLTTRPPLTCLTKDIWLFLRGYNWSCALMKCS